MTHGACIIAGSNRFSAEVLAPPAFNGTAQEASPCIGKKISAGRTSLNMPGPDATYQVFEAACKADDPNGCWILSLALLQKPQSIAI